jgi:hypothetical protein
MTENIHAIMLEIEIQTALHHISCNKHFLPVTKEIAADSMSSITSLYRPIEHIIR